MEIDTYDYTPEKQSAFGQGYDAVMGSGQIENPFEELSASWQWFRDGMLSATRVLRWKGDNADV
jgi:hypothetical protein